MVKNAIGGGQNDKAELTRRQKVVHPSFDVDKWNIEAWRNGTSLVKAAKKVYNDFAGTMVVDDFEFADIA